MFYLRDLPNDKILMEIAKRYPRMEPLSTKACLTLLRTGSDLLTAFENMLVKYGLSQGRFTTLMVMNRVPDESISPSLLAEKVGVSRATMTGLLDGLERNGLVKRQAHSEDRRKLSVRLTVKGCESINALLPDYYDRISKFMENLTENERLELVSLLEKINQSLSSI